MTLRTIIITAVTAFVLLTSSATAVSATEKWQISRQGQSPRAGDRMSVTEIEWPLSVKSLPRHSDRESMAGTLWDLSASGYRDHGNIRSYDCGSDSVSLSCTYGGCRSFFRMSGDTVFLTGYEDRNVIMSDSTGILRYVFPGKDDGTAAAKFRLDGAYCMERAAVRCGESSAFTGSLGGIVLPSGDTIRDLQYVMSVEKYNTDMSLNPDRLITSFCDTLPVSVRQSMLCYARGYRYPVLELCLTEGRHKGKLHYSVPVALICPPTEQEYAIRNDVYNETIRKEAERNGGHSHEDGDTDSMKPLAGLTLSLEGQMLNVNFESGVSTGYMELIVSDSGGIRYRHILRTPIHEGLNAVSIDCSGLPLQEYALLLIYGNQIESLKFTLR